MRDVLLVASFGALGAVGRYWVSGWTHELLGKQFAWGTLVVNLVGCFLLGAFSYVATEVAAVSPSTRAALAFGFLGAFTTFSTFGYDTFQFLEQKQWAIAAANVAANVVVGLLCVWGGIALARALYGP